MTAVATTAPRASEVYALSQGKRCAGTFECYWCGAPCSRQFEHRQRRRMIGEKNDPLAYRPGSGWQCVGCWLWRRPRITISFVHGSFRDSQKAADYAWLVTPQEAKAVLPGPALYPLLLKPPCTFFLSLLVDSRSTHLQRCAVNDNTHVHGNTPLHYTLDNKPYQYTVYELEHWLRHGGSGNGKEGGVRLLVQTLGKPPEDLLPKEVPVFEDKKRGKGRPKEQDSEARDAQAGEPRKLVVRSGA